MPRRERDREIAWRRKRNKETRKLRAKGLLPPVQTPKESVKEVVKEAEKKKPEKVPPKETPTEESKEAGEPSTQEGQS
jgi:hypothetical protein